jgi:hypothetical protein
LDKGRHYELRFQGCSLPPVALTLDAARFVGVDPGEGACVSPGNWI